MGQESEILFGVREHDRSVILEIQGAQMVFRLTIESARILAEQLTNTALEAETKYLNVVEIKDFQ